MGRLPPFSRPAILLILFSISVVTLLSVPISRVYHPPYVFKSQVPLETSFVLTESVSSYNLTLDWIVSQIELTFIKTNGTPISIRAVDDSGRTSMLLQNVTMLERASLVLENHQSGVIQFVREYSDATVDISYIREYSLFSPPAGQIVNIYWVLLLLSIIIVVIYGFYHIEKYRISVVKTTDNSYTDRINWPRYRGPSLLALYLFVAYCLILPGLFTMVPPEQYYHGDLGTWSSYGEFYPEPVLVHTQSYNLSLNSANPTATIVVYNNSIYSNSVIHLESLSTGNVSVAIRLTSQDSELLFLRNVSTSVDDIYLGFNLTASVCIFTVNRINSDTFVSFDVIVFTYDEPLMLRNSILASSIVIGAFIIIIVIFWDVKLERVYEDL